MTDKKPFSPEEFKTIYSKVPRLCVDLIIKTLEGIVLTLRDIAPYKGKWHFPGGTVLYGEKVTDTIRRIAKEEIGVSVNVEKLLGYIEYPSEEKDRGFGYTITMAFLCSSAGTEMKPNEQASAIKAFKELPDNMIEEQKAFLQSIPGL